MTGVRPAEACRRLCEADHGSLWLLRGALLHVGAHHGGRARPTSFPVASGATHAPGSRQETLTERGGGSSPKSPAAQSALGDANALHHLAQLLTHPGREFHAIDLEAAERQVAPAVVGGTRPGSGEPQFTLRPDLGDAGFHWDAAANAAHQSTKFDCEDVGYRQVA
jgi:hypothetical protein